jgi:hypothetical protein
LALAGRFWDPLDIESVGRLIGRHTQRKPKELSAAELKKEFPGSLTFVQRNNGLVALGLVVVVIVVGVVLTDGLR